MQHRLRRIITAIMNMSTINRKICGSIRVTNTPTPYNTKNKLPATISITSDNRAENAIAKHIPTNK